MENQLRSKAIILIVAGMLVALLAGVAGGWLMRDSEVQDLQERIASLEAEGPAAEDDATQTDDVQADDDAAMSEEPPASESDDSPAAADASGSTSVTERQPGLIVEVTGAPGAYTMRIDYVLWLTGPEAAAAAAAHGDESPPPNDYYVVNDNPKIREFPIRSGIPVTVVTNDDGTSDPEGHTITLDQWVAALSGPSAHAFKATIYWITITDGTVTAIEAQYVP